MRIAKVMKVLDADLLSSSVAETEFPAWSVGSGATITIASPAVVTLTSIPGVGIADGYVKGSPITFTTTGALPTGITAGTTYYTGNVDGSQTTFNLYTDSALTTIVNTSGSQSGTHTIHGPQHYNTLGARVQVTNPSFTFIDTTAASLLIGVRPRFTITGPIITQLADDVPVVLSTTGSLLSGFEVGKLYYIRDYSYSIYGNVTFRLTDKKGGAPIVAAGASSGTHTLTALIHSIYELTTVGTDTTYGGDSPLSSSAATAAVWSKVSATNPWRMFDESVGSQTNKADSIVVSIQGRDYIDTIGLFDIAGTAAHAVITDATAGVVYDVTHDLMDYSGLTDEWAYCFDPVEYLSSLVLFDLPMYPDCVIDITITNTGATALCGACLPCSSRDFGFSQLGASIGIQDYSVKSQDDWGNYTITERAFAKRASFDVVVENTLINRLQTVLEEYRATPALYIGADDYTGTMVYGFYKDFNVVIAYQDQSICSIEIEGLT